MVVLLCLLLFTGGIYCIVGGPLDLIQLHVVLLNCYGCYLAFSDSLGSFALVYCTSIATISRRGVKEKLYFPGGLLT